MKNKLKSEIFNYKVYKQKCFSVITKNLNWEILTKNLVTFKRWDGVKDDKFEYYGGSLKIRFLRGGGFTKNQYIGGLPKKGRLGQFADLTEGLAKKRGVVFLRGGLIPQCTL